MLKKFGKGLMNFMSDKVQVCKEILSSAQNRLIVGCVIVGLGIGLGEGLIISAYIHVPA